MFINWIRSEYGSIIVPVGRLAFNPQYLNAIYLKVALIVKYCEDDSQLATSRNSLDQMRAEIRPGIVDPSKVEVKRRLSPPEFASLVSIMEGTSSLLSNKSFITH